MVLHRVVLIIDIKEVASESQTIDKIVPQLQKDWTGQNEVFIASLVSTPLNKLLASARFDVAPYNVYPPEHRGEAVVPGTKGSSYQYIAKK